MIQRSTVFIDKKKSNEFIKFMESNAKDKSFWEDIKKTASSEINKEDLEKMFKKES